MNRLQVLEENLPIYDILFEHSFDALVDEMIAHNSQQRKICIITDTNVCQFYLEALLSLLKPHVKDIHAYVFQAGEAHKNLDTVSNIYEYLIQHKYDRTDLLLALGGGVVGDITGYAAATYLRGIDFVQVPTTLLAQVDSSIGGKTGVDFNVYKNMVGAFHQPKLVYINLQTLDTLPDREFYSGIAEIIKHGLILDKNYYEWLKENRIEILGKNVSVLAEMIYKSCLIKRTIVENDPKELGERALLNFGHTLGHAIEKIKMFTLLHGECVALGMIGASYLSLQKGYLTKETHEEIVQMLQHFNLPININEINLDEIIATTKLDKKVNAGQLKFILLASIGKAFIDSSVEDWEVKNALQTMSQ